MPPERGFLVGRTALERKTVHMPDCLADTEYSALEYQSMGHYRSMLGVPLLREGVSIGVIALMRTAVLPFTEKQIELVTTFADQAVIAIENVRLFDEVQAKTRDLTEALTYQTGSANILKVIASSPTDVGPVLKAIVESACELCEAYDAIVRAEGWRRPAFQRTSRSDPDDTGEMADQPKLDRRAGLRRSNDRCTCTTCTRRRRRISRMAGKCRAAWGTAQF